jgi:hypothetical protein
MVGNRKDGGNVTYEIWDKISQPVGIDPFAAAGPQISQDDFILYRNDTGDVIAMESIATLRAVFGYSGDIDEVAAAHQVYMESITPVVTLATIKAAKISELSTACEAAIVGGVDVVTEYGAEHFSMTLEDQINIKAMGDLGHAGIGWLYHPDGGACKMYSAADLVAIHSAASGWKTQQLTYYNFLRQWIEREDDAEEIQSISYGAELPADLAATMNALLVAVSGGGS